MEQFLLVTLNGLSLAGVYFLVASGLTLIFGLMRVITMAHGTMYLLGGYIGYVIARETGQWWLAILGSAVVVGLLGLFIHQVLIRRFQDDDMRVALITLGVSLIGADLMSAVFGGVAYQVPAPSAWMESVSLPGVEAYPLARLLMLALSIVIGILLWLLINRTRYGSIVRAGVDDSEMTAATGINIRFVFASIFVLGSALAAVAGVANGTLFPLLPGQDGVFLLYSLVVVIVGGMGSIAGAAVGAVLVGLISQFGLVFAPSYANVLTFALMVVVLAVRPQGILGRKTA